MIKQLQDKISALEITSVSQANLPSVAMSNPQEECGIHSQIFDYVPGTINTKRGAAKYDIQDQAFSIFHKQVRFQDGCSSPDLNIPPTVGQGPQSSTPYHASNVALNQTFDGQSNLTLNVSGCTPGCGCYSSRGFCSYSCSSFQGVLMHVGT